MVSPKIEELSNANPGVIFVKIDVDEAAVRAPWSRVASASQSNVICSQVLHVLWDFVHPSPYLACLQCLAVVMRLGLQLACRWTTTAW